MTEIDLSTIGFRQLVDDLKKDGITVSDSIILQAKNGYAIAINSIGFDYDSKLQQYDKAMAWYRLAASKDNSRAQNNIGVLYGKGLGAPKDNRIALEWYLKAAIQNNKNAWGNIGFYFECGRGVPADKYKALEWYHKSGTEPDRLKALTEQGIQITEQDKDKPLKQLLHETEDIIWEARINAENKLRQQVTGLDHLKTKAEEESRNKDAKIKLLEKEKMNYLLAADKKKQEVDILLKEKDKREAELNEEISSLKLLKNQMDEEFTSKIKSLEEENQAYHLIAEHRQQENESNEKYNQEIERMNSEIQALKLANRTTSTQLEVKDIQIKTLENVIVSLYTVSDKPKETTSSRIEELEHVNTKLEKLNQNLEKLLEQEKRLKDNEIMLLKQQMKSLLRRENQERREVE